MPANLSNHQMFIARRTWHKTQIKNCNCYKTLPLPRGQLWTVSLSLSIQIKGLWVLRSAWPHPPSRYHNLVPTRCRVGTGVGVGSPLGRPTAQCTLLPHHCQQERAHHNNHSLQNILLLLLCYNNFTLVHYKEEPEVCTCVIMVMLLWASWNVRLSV